MRRRAPAPEPSCDPGRQRSNPVTGWRQWYVASNGELSTLNRSGRWPQVELDAECHTDVGNARTAPHVPHPETPAPGEGCSCGIRIVEDLAHLLRITDEAARILRSRRSSVPPNQWAWQRDRVAWNVWGSPDVIGGAIGWGRCLPGVCDPPTTWRVQHAAVAGRLHLSPHLWRRARSLARRYEVQVVVGSELGLAWVDEIAEYEKSPRADTGSAVVCPTPAAGGITDATHAAGADGTPLGVRSAPGLDRGTTLPA